jgi:probable addiction module antidote protein
MNQKKTKKLPNYENWLIESLQDPQEAEAYLQAALDEYQNDGDSEALMLAFRHLAQAQGGIGQLAEKAHLNRESLYKTLSSKGNPRLETITRLSNALGFHLKIETDAR